MSAVFVKIVDLFQILVYNYSYNTNDWRSIIMCDHKQVKIDDDNLDESALDVGCAISDTYTHYSIEPSNEKDYDVYLMTGNNNGKGSEKK